MARKMQLDTAIVTDMKAVASDSFKDNIRMIEVDKIKPCLDNFYSIGEIEMLADDIERQGLKHNLVVTEDAENTGYYFIKSGHRRFTAIQHLISENRYTSNFIPCLIDGVKTQSENILDLIMLNATTRVMSDSELYKQYEILRDTLEKLKQEGKKIKWRLRENVAAFLNISPAQVGKIENIKHNAVEEIQTAVEQGDLSIATADKIAKLSEEEQKELVSENDLKEIKTSDIKPRSKPAPEQKESHPETLEEDILITEDDSEDEGKYTFPETGESEPDLSEEDIPVTEDNPEDIEEDTSPESEESKQDFSEENEPDTESETLSEKEHCQLYCQAIEKALQNFQKKIEKAETIKAIDKAVTKIQAELRIIMEEI